MTTLPLTAAHARLRESATPAEGRALDRALEALEQGVDITPIPGAFLVKSFSGSTTYELPHTGGCSCQARMPTCKHRWVIELLSAAHARPAGTTLPNVGDTLAAAERYTTMPRLERAKQVIDAFNADLFA